MRFSEAQNVRDLRTLAKRRLPSIVFDYIDGGVEDEKGLAHNRKAFDNIRIVPRYLVDISERKLGKSFFGQDYLDVYGYQFTDERAVKETAFAARAR